MSVDIGDVLSRGVRRTVARNGLLLVGIVYVLGVASSLFGPRRPPLAARPGGPGPGGFPAGEMPMTGMADPVIPVTPVVAAVIGVIFSLLTAVVSIGALRTFLTDDRTHLSGDRFTRRIGWVLLNVVVGGIVFAVAVGIGFLLLVVPGLFLLVSLVFWTVVVVDEDTSFVEGFRRSWGLTSGRRLRLFLLGLVVVVLVAVVNVLFGAVGSALGFVTPLLGIVVGQIGSAFTTVFTWAALAAAYRQLTDTTDVAGGIAD